MAELIGGRPKKGCDEREIDEVWGEESRWEERRWWTGEEEEAKWIVKGEKVLELGAGG